MFMRLIAIPILCCIFCSLARAQDTQLKVSPGSRAAVVVLKGEIDDFARDSIEKRFTEARAAGAKTIILDIDTYGGLVTAGLDISNFIKRQTDLHTIAFVDEKAISAGAMIALACDEIVMDPSAVIGDCAPIVFKTDGAIDTMGATERAKAASPVLADFLDSAARNGYDPQLAEAMVVIDHPMSAWKDSDGRVQFTAASAAPAGFKPIAGVVNPLNSADTLLTLHTQVAHAVGLAKGVATSPEVLASDRGLQLAGTFAPGNGEKAVEFLTEPGVRLILIIVFLAALKIGLSAPGHGAAEAVALISFGLLVGMPLLTGYAQWWEVAIIFAGVALIAFEVFVFPGHFVSAALGTLMVMVGLILTFTGRDGAGWWPQTPQMWDDLARGVIVVALGFAGALGAWIWLGRFLPTIPYFNRLVLTAVSGQMKPSEILVQGGAPEPCWPPIGSIGQASTELKPGGSAMFADGVLGDTRQVAVVSDRGYVSPGTQLVVRESRGNRVLVSPV